MATTLIPHNTVQSKPLSTYLSLVRSKLSSTLKKSWYIPPFFLLFIFFTGKLNQEGMSTNDVFQLGVGLIFGLGFGALTSQNALSRLQLSLIHI